MRRFATYTAVKRYDTAMTATNDEGFAEWYEAFYGAIAEPPTDWRQLLTHFDNSPGLRHCWEAQ